MNKINKALIIGILLLTGARTVNATTDDTVWDFTWGSTDYTSTSGDVSDCWSGCYYGNTFELTSGTSELDITAWSDTGHSSTVENANVSHNDGGLLNYNRNWVQNSTGDWHLDDDHTVDNALQRDMLLLTFEEAVRLTSLKIGWYKTDSDITIAAFDSLPTLTGNTWSSIASAASYVASYSNFVVGSFATINEAAYEAQYWLVGSYNKFLSNKGWTSSNDYIKIAGLTTHVSDKETSNADSGTPTTQANAPSTFAILGLALSVLWLRRRISK